MDIMTVEQGYEKAKHMNVGYKICMGPNHAEMKRIDPLTLFQVSQMNLPNITWLGRELGFEPSLWARFFAELAKRHGHTPTLDEWKWLHGPATLIEAREWIGVIIEESEALTL